MSNSTDTRQESLKKGQSKAKAPKGAGLSKPEGTRAGTMVDTRAGKQEANSVPADRSRDGSR